MKYPISTSIHLFFDSNAATLNDQITRHIQAGFRHLDFNFLDWAAFDDCPFWHESGKDWILSARETAERQGAIFNQAHAPCPVLNLRNELARYEEACARAFDGCRLLGIPWMVFHHVENQKNYQSNLTKWEFDKVFFSKMLEHAHRTGVGIAVENLSLGGEVRGERLSPVSYVLALCDELNDPLLGICCDVGHAHIERFNCLNLGDDSVNPGDAIRRFGSRLKALHIHDNSSAGDEHIPPFYGTIDWADVMHALDEISYAHSFTFEAHNAVRRFPEPLKDEAAALLYKMGVLLVGRD